MCLGTILRLQIEVGDGDRVVEDSGDGRWIMVFSYDTNLSDIDTVRDLECPERTECEETDESLESPEME